MEHGTLQNLPVPFLLGRSGVKALPHHSHSLWTFSGFIVSDYHSLPRTDKPRRNVPVLLGPHWVFWCHEGVTHPHERGGRLSNHRLEHRVHFNHPALVVEGQHLVTLAKGLDGHLAGRGGDHGPRWNTFVADEQVGGEPQHRLHHQGPSLAALALTAAEGVVVQHFHNQPGTGWVHPIGAQAGVVGHLHVAPGGPSGEREREVVVERGGERPGPLGDRLR